MTMTTFITFIIIIIIITTFYLVLCSNVRHYFDSNYIN